MSTLRLGLVLLGVLTLAAAWLGAFGRLLPGPFSAHMTMHMAVVAVAAPLFAFGVAGTWADPVGRWPRCFSVAAASIAELILVWAWHTPALHHAARHSSGGVVYEQASFLLSGLWLWGAAVGGDRRERAGAGIVGLLLTCMHMTLLGALLALPPRVLYEHANHGVEAHAARISPLADQHLGGAIMIVFGGAAYLCGGLWLALGLLQQKRRAPLAAARPAPVERLP
ncbi:MAG TPA: cytochrome c oxidase assembly protein [Polyangiaceae bacterium]|nr:cytochrome c oxidase assembly protein [Polyangiaceae bacterium]